MKDRKKTSLETIQIVGGSYTKNVEKRLPGVDTKMLALFLTQNPYPRSKHNMGSAFREKSFCRVLTFWCARFGMSRCRDLGGGRGFHTKNDAKKVLTFWYQPPVAVFPWNLGFILFWQCRQILFGFCQNYSGARHPTTQLLFGNMQNRWCWETPVVLFLVQIILKFC